MVCSLRPAFPKTTCVLVFLTGAKPLPHSYFWDLKPNPLVFGVEHNCPPPNLSFYLHTQVYVININVPLNVTGSEKTAHFVQNFKIELMVLMGK